MKFRKGSRHCKWDKLRLQNGQIECVSPFNYLGVRLSSRDLCFRAHIKDRIGKCTVTMTSILHPQELPIDTALRFSDAKVALVGSYGIQMTWQNLTVTNLEALREKQASGVASGRGRLGGLPRLPHPRTSEGAPFSLVATKNTEFFE